MENFLGNYGEKITSSEWNVSRGSKKSQQKYCQSVIHRGMNIYSSETHHMRYDNGDCEMLCRECHKREHNGFSLTKNYLNHEEWQYERALTEIVAMAEENKEWRLRFIREVSSIFLDNIFFKGYVEENYPDSHNFIQLVLNKVYEEGLHHEVYSYYRGRYNPFPEEFFEEHSLPFNDYGSEYITVENKKVTFKDNYVKEFNRRSSSVAGKYVDSYTKELKEQRANLFMNSLSQDETELFDDAEEQYITKNNIETKELSSEYKEKVKTMTLNLCRTNRSYLKNLKNDLGKDYFLAIMGTNLFFNSYGLITVDDLFNKLILKVDSDLIWNVTMNSIDRTYKTLEEK